MGVSLEMSFKKKDRGAHNFYSQIVEQQKPKEDEKNEENVQNSVKIGKKNFFMKFKLKI